MRTAAPPIAPPDQGKKLQVAVCSALLQRLVSSASLLLSLPLTPVPALLLLLPLMAALLLLLTMGQEYVPPL